jgi:NAD(P)-dependent dehydrogenase (short-subunit alcohol dehydrogenase family)
MERRTCIVTGGSSGVGRAIARGLARAGAEVIVASRDPQRGEEAVRAIRAETGNPQVSFSPVDLGDPGSIRSFVAGFSRTHGALHVLSNNGAHLSRERQESPFGTDSIFGVNYLGHFLLTRLLLDPLIACAPSRIVTVTGTAGMIRRVRFDLEEPVRPERFSPLGSTLQAALAKTLFTFELARRLAGTRVTANAFHPGGVRSSLARSLPWYLRAPVSAAMMLAPTECRTGVFLCLDPSVEAVSGKFFERSRVVPFAPPWDVGDAARRLWDMSESLTAGA